MSSLTISSPGIIFWNSSQRTLSILTFFGKSSEILWKVMSTRIKHLYSFGPSLLDTGESVLKRKDVTVPLGPQEFDTLAFMVQHRGHLLSREEFGKQIWPDTTVKQRTGLDRIISNVRKALGEFGDKYIETVPKRG